MKLQCYDFYNQLTEQDREFLKIRAKPIEVSKDTILFYQGDVCENILFLAEGNVRLIMQSDNGDEITLYTLYPGEQCIVNTASTLSATQAIATAIATTDIRGYLLDSHSLKELAKRSDIYQDYLFSLYTLRLDDLAKLVHSVKFKKLNERVMDWLYEQNTKEVKVTHETLANELGSSREVISKVLKNLQNDGKVTLHRGIIEITAVS